MAEERSFLFLAEKPLEFLRDPETGRVALLFFSSFHFQGHTLDTPMGVLLTTEAARALLADLPALEALLVEAARVPTKPSSVQ